MSNRFFQIRKDFLPDIRFLSHLGNFFSGNAIAQVIPILCIPILSRYYTPVDFGEWGLFVAVVSMATIIATGRIEAAIIVPEKEIEAINLGIALLLLSVVVSVVLSVIFIMVGIFLPTLFSFDTSRSLFLLAILFATSLCLGSIRQGVNYWLYREHLYQQVYKANILRSIGYCSIAVTMGFFQDRISIVNGMVAGTAAGEVVAGLYVYYVTLRHINYKWHNWAEIGLTVTKYRHFVIWGIPGDVLNSLANQLPLFFLYHFSNAYSLGQFVMARRVLSMPTALLSKSTGDVFVAYASEDIRKTGNCLGLYIRTFFLLSMISLPLFSVLMIISPKIFPLIFGSQWILAGQLARPISVLCGIGFVASTLGRLLQIAGRQKLDFFWQTILFVVVLGTISIIAIDYSIVKFTWYFSLSYGICYVVYLIFSYLVSRYPKKKLWRLILR